jgi:hypothetical protein
VRIVGKAKRPFFLQLAYIGAPQADPAMHYCAVISIDEDIHENSRRVLMREIEPRAIELK